MSNKSKLFRGWDPKALTGRDPDSIPKEDPGEDANPKTGYVDYKPDPKDPEKVISIPILSRFDNDGDMLPIYDNDLTRVKTKRKRAVRVSFDVVQFSDAKGNCCYGAVNVKVI